MTLISVLVSLALDRAMFTHRDSAPAGWFSRVGAAIAARLPAGMDGVVGAVIVSLPPAVVIAILQGVVDDWLFGLISLVLGVVVLLFALGPLDPATLIDDYMDARRLDDHERSDWYFERFTGEPRPASSAVEGRRMVEAVFYQSHDHLFATVFWFCILGPAGAVLYRMAAEIALRPTPAMVARPGLLSGARRVLGVLGWIPARLIAFGYAMTGSFEEALHRLRHGLRGDGEDLLASNQQLLAETGAAALRRSPEERDDAAPADAERRSHDPVESVEAARALSVRTAVLWLAILALFTLSGWIA